jgi:hypothetical protein
VYIGGQWILLILRIYLSSLVKIAHGKMAQMLLLQIFSNAFCTYMSIECENLVNDLSTINPSDDFFYFVLKILNLFNSANLEQIKFHFHIYFHTLSQHINDIFFY